MHRNSIIVSTKQKRIAALAKQSPEMAFTSLAYLMDIDWLKEAYRRTRKDGAVGVDGVTAEQYEQDLEGNLQSLLDRAKSGTYKAPPVRRVHIPKGGSSTETRPLGIPTLEDKVHQRAVITQPRGLRYARCFEPFPFQRHRGGDRSVSKEAGNHPAVAVDRHGDGYLNFRCVFGNYRWSDADCRVSGEN
jgi:hypothetical protein